VSNGDRKWMERALELARKGVGLTRPNPPVGSVVVKGNKLVAEGWHKKAGALHAERMALLNAGSKAKHATLYVTLEPCSTWGRTPPCTDIIIDSGIERVVLSVIDPNPVHAGKGIRILEKAGIKVVTGICAAEGKELIQTFSCWITQNRPFISLKLAMSMDGKIADSKGHSKWITGPDARKYVQGLRRRTDAILVGTQTVIKDNPHLIPQPAYGRKPYRLILDTSGRIPLNRNVFKDENRAQTIYVTTNNCSPTRIKMLEKMGIQVWKTRMQKGHISLSHLMKQAHKYGIMHILCEGGGELAAGLLQNKFVDEYFLFYAPCIIGGDAGVSSMAGKGWQMGQLPQMKDMSCEQLGKDLLIRANPV